MNMKYFEKQLAQKGIWDIAGVDEAGRGPLAGPVVSAAVIFPKDFNCPDIKDSKKISPKKRAALFQLIKNEAVATSIGICDHKEIDNLNILYATLLSMKRAVDSLTVSPNYLIIDGKFILNLEKNHPLVGHQKAIIKGDEKSISIAAASIIAKVTRDRIMIELDKIYPEYRFAIHKGYPTKTHKQALARHGPCLIHRMTFNGVKNP